jgi:16S rRNA (guanine527-N7)-methyltransferase
VFAELLGAKLAGICEVSGSQAERLRRHYELLVRWNRVINLTASRTLEDAVERHYCESLFAACHLPPSHSSIADLGSGAGFPGIPVAVMRPDCSVVLIESHQRKAAFLREAIRELGLANVRVIPGRAAAVQESFEWVVSRAVKFRDIAEALKKLAPRAALLTGEIAGADMPGFQWDPPIRLPWGERRYLWIGTQAVARPGQT